MLDWILSVLGYGPAEPKPQNSDYSLSAPIPADRAQDAQTRQAYVTRSNGTQSHQEPFPVPEGFISTSDPKLGEKMMEAIRKANEKSEKDEEV